MMLSQNISISTAKRGQNVQINWVLNRLVAKD